VLLFVLFAIWRRCVRLHCGALNLASLFRPQDLCMINSRQSQPYLGIHTNLADASHFPLYTPRRYIIQVLSDLAAKQNITDISDDHIVAWANEKVRFL
jgi:hypothetical protein